MRRNCGVLRVFISDLRHFDCFHSLRVFRSTLLPVIFRNSHNVFSFNQLGTLPLYRSLGIGVGIGIGLGLDLKRRAVKEKKEDVERIELHGLDELGGGVRAVSPDSQMVPKQVICDCPVWGLSTPPSASGVRRCAWGSSGV
jgi:hypothetical protein